MKRFGSQIGAVWPHDRAELFVECNPAEIVGVGEGFENTAPVPAGKIDLSFGPVRERKAKAVVSEGCDARYVDDLRHGFMLRKWVDPLERKPLTSALPVVLELSAVKRCPLADKSQSAVR
jgi:hypothetical protein